LYFAISGFYQVHAEDHDRSTATILNSAEKFFISLREREFDIVWGLLSEKSHKTIINDVYKDLRKFGSGIKKENIVSDFNSNGALFKNYWFSFLSNFNPETVLEQSLWEMGNIKKNKAEIILTHKKSEMPTRLKMYKENGIWKIGLVETFWTRKTMKFLHFIFQ
jgi:hypothetical protein